MAVQTTGMWYLLTTGREHRQAPLLKTEGVFAGANQGVLK